MSESISTIAETDQNMQTLTPPSESDQSLDQIKLERQREIDDFIEKARKKVAEYEKKKGDKKGRISYIETSTNILDEIKKAGFTLEELIGRIQLKKSLIPWTDLKNLLEKNAEDIKKGPIHNDTEKFLTELRALYEAVKVRKFDFTEFRQILRDALRDERKKVTLEEARKNRDIPRVFRDIIGDLLAGEPIPPPSPP